MPRLGPGLIIIALSLGLCGPTLAQKNLGFDNTKPSGQPYLSPEESLARMQVAPGFEVKLFAAEPDIINPIAFTVDERGRLWVVECYEYPKRTPPGKKPRDRIKLLEDTTGAGRADRVTVWAEGKDLPIGFDLATGIEVGNGGVYLGAAPHLFFLRDSKGTGHCDQQTSLLRGFGSQDTHETLNTLQWGPDGWLYGLHGIFTRSRVGDVRLNAAVWRYNTASKKFEVFAEGTSNPWGLDFDAHGQAFLTACVIPHAFHMVPGGVYIRQAGGSLNPYAYGFLHEISDHLHHQESGWAHAGALVLQGDNIPPAYRGSLLMGSIHGSSIKRDVLRRNASTFIASHAVDFLMSDDKNFRPINMRWGPDGSIYVIDWHDQNACHQAQPDSWDMTHGRIYKIQRTGQHAPPCSDLSQRTTQALVELLKNNNPWWHRTALRLLRERRDVSVAPSLKALLDYSDGELVSLRALWALHAVGGFDEAVAEKALHHVNPSIRTWGVRFLSEGGHVSSRMLDALTELARSESAPEVRSQLASSAQRLARQDTLPLLHQLMGHQEDVADPNIPLLIWLAYEPCVMSRRDEILGWLKQHAAGNTLVTNEIMPRVLRRLLADGQGTNLGECIALVSDLRDMPARRRVLRALVEALQEVHLAAPAHWSDVFGALARDSDPETQALARRLRVCFGDPRAVRGAIALAVDTKAPAGTRIDVIRDLVLARSPQAAEAMLHILADDPEIEVRRAACRALACFTETSIASKVLAHWKTYPGELRNEAVNLLAARRDWATMLLSAVARHEVALIDLNENTILRIRAFHDAQLDRQIEAVWGKIRESSPDLDRLINEMKTHLYEGGASFERGRRVFDMHCAKCHRFEGRGHDVGPSLDGAARDIGYLLVNVLDPNRIVGQAYYTRVVALKDGRVETGLLAAEDMYSITLKNENDLVKVIPRKDIEEMKEHAKSLMPEGLDKSMSVQDYRDLIRYLMANPFLTDVAVAGPLPAGAAKRVMFSDPSAALPGMWRWPAIGPPGRMELPDSGANGDRVALVAANAVAPDMMVTSLQLGAVHPVEAWLNGRPVYVGQPSNRIAEPDQASVKVRLQKGVNRLVFRIVYQGKKELFYARLLDPLRRLRYEDVRR
jgi:putative membrane-bound dehydrogenase-like protein